MFSPISLSVLFQLYRFVELDNNYGLHLYIRKSDKSHALYYQPKNKSIAE